MPVGLDTSEHAPVSLRSDADKPEDVRPVFLFHYLTRRERRAVFAALDEIRNPDSDVEALLDKALRIGLVGWRNMRGRDGAEIPFSPDAVDDVLTAAEKFELAFAYPDVVAETEAGLKKKLDSPPSPGTASSAPAAAPPASA